MPEDDIRRPLLERALSRARRHPSPAGPAGPTVTRTGEVDQAVRESTAHRFVSLADLTDWARQEAAR